jgi:hypothetical protein
MNAAYVFSILARFEQEDKLRELRPPQARATVSAPLDACATGGSRERLIRERLACDTLIEGRAKHMLSEGRAKHMLSRRKI